MEIELQVHKHLFKRAHNIISGNINSAFHGLNLAAIHEQEKWPSTDVWDHIPKRHNKHTGSVRGDVILSCDCKKG